MLRIWPLVTCSRKMSSAALNSSSPQSPEMSTPLLDMIRPSVSRISLSTPTRPLRSGFQRSSTVRRPFGQLLLVPADAGEAALPRQGLRAARVEVDVQQVGVEVGLVRDLGVVEGLRVAEADPAADHPVGEADGVGADVLAERELVFDLAVVGVVVVDVDLVVDRRCRVSAVNAFERRVVARVVLVEVQRPVGPGEGLVVRRVVRRRRRLGRAAGRARGEGEGGRRRRRHRARMVRRVSCARRACTTSERISGSSGRDRVMGMLLQNARKGGACAPCVDTDIRRVARERRCGGNAHSET